MIKVGFKRLTNDAILPIKAHPTDSGFDLFANEGVIIEPGETKLIKTGIAIQLPSGYEAQVRPRSGVTSKTKLRVQLGTIDNGYTGEIGIIADNINPRQLAVRQIHYIDDEPFNSEVLNGGTHIHIIKGDKLAQLVIQALPQVDDYEIDKLPVTDRGSNGFGSSGY